MEKQHKIMFELDDIIIKYQDPKEGNVCVEKDSMLPIFVMTDEIGEETDKIFKIISNKKGVNSNVLFGNVKNVFAEMTLSEVKEILIENSDYVKKRNVSLNIFLRMTYMNDIVCETISILKNLYDDIKIIVGIASTPDAYASLSEAGADYVLIGSPEFNIGCGVGYPEGSLINDAYEIKSEIDKWAKIIAYVSSQTTHDMIKALALGSNYVLFLNDVHNDAYAKSETLSENIIDFHESLEQALFFTGSENLNEFNGSDFHFVTDTYKKKESNFMINIKARNNFYNRK